MKIEYTFVTGEKIEIEVDEELSQEIEQIESKEKSNNRREGRRHQSYSDDNDKRDSFVDETVDVEGNAYQNIDNAKLKAAIGSLLPHQRKLIQEVFLAERSIADIALEDGVNEAAIRDRLKKIYRKLKKYLRQHRTKHVRV